LDNQTGGLTLIPNLAAGVYNVTVTDNNGCTAECSFTINQPGCDIAVTGVETDVTCFNGNDGSIEITVTNAIGNVDFDWNDNTLDGIEDPTGLTAGMYTLTATDGNNCEAQVTLTIEQPLEMTATATTADICEGAADGTINIMVTNGFPTFNFAWDNGNTTGNGAGTTIDNLTAGIYDITITDGNGCTATTTATINEIGAPMAINVTESCNQTGSEYTISFTITGGDTNSYTVMGDAGMLIGNTFTSEPIADNATYNFIVDDGNGCNPFMVTGSFDCPDCLPITFDLAVTSEIGCNGDSDGVALVSSVSNNAIPAISYNWSNGDQLSEAENLTTGWTSVTVTDAIGCFGIDSIFLDQPEPLTANLISNDSPCFGENNGSILFENVEGGTAPYNYSIDGVNFSNQIQYNFLSPGLFNIAVEDANGCMFEQDMSILEPEEFLVDLGLDTIVALGDSILLNPDYGFIVVDTFIWLGVDCINCPEVMITPTQATTVSLTIESLNGCLASDALFLGVNTDVKVFLPNVFSPNNDGTNDFFYPQALSGVKQITEFVIFDRWGEQLFQVYDFSPNDITYGWDGTYRGKVLNPQVCVWYCEVELTNGRKEIVKGDVTIVR
jgi:gliding motility-associated-like protein